ncbi:MAG: type II toxin-antitoxin system Phd/YefM family antitoxin [Verrucomicrobiae bacterium]|nr:type II toxin-antitoxin system Phd/YefM family antitoxin [Verrucomicrobiae bacterium]
MILSPQVIEKEEKKEFVVIPYQEFTLIKQSLEDYEDLCFFRKEKLSAIGEATRSLDDILEDGE